ncbi:MAG: glycosyltransferase family 2 protein, partial [Solirubrobacteraceae bacterium]
MSESYLPQTTGACAERARRADLAIITISTNEARWLRPCLSSVFEHSGGAALDVVVVDNSSTDGT